MGCRNKEEEKPTLHKKVPEKNTSYLSFLFFFFFSFFFFCQDVGQFGL